MIADATRKTPELIGDDANSDFGNGPVHCFWAYVAVEFILKGGELWYDLLEMISDLFAQSGKEKLALPWEINLESVKVVANALSKRIRHSDSPSMLPTSIRPTS